MAKIFVPATDAEAWKQFLAQPEKQWRTGYSARTLAHCWQAADGFPPSVAAAFENSPHPELHGMEMLLGLPEHKVALPGGRRASQTDLFVLARGRGGLTTIAVEGKVREPFGELVGEWIAPQPSPTPGEADREPSEGRRERLSFLCAKLGLDEGSVSSLRYQLLHRTVSALLEAERFSASQAVMLVHAFGGNDDSFRDFVAFARLLGAEGARGTVAKARSGTTTPLYLGWADGEEQFLNA